MLRNPRVAPPDATLPLLVAALLALLAGALAAGAAPARAALPQQSGTISSLAPTNLEIEGPLNSLRFGSSVAIGDVNGDGIDDMIIGDSDPLYKTGGAYVIYGTKAGEPTKVTIPASGEIPPSEGFRIFAPSGSNLYAGRAVADAGDVNGDGYDDVVVGANGIGGNYGGAFVIYGGPHDGTVELSEAGLPESVGFMVKAPGEVDNAGISVAGGEDVNGDGIDDIVIGDGGYDAFTPGDPNTGAAFVVYGKDGDRPTVQLGSLAANGEGFAIIGAGPNDYLEAVGMAGDVNGDGIGDVVVGASGTYQSTGFKGYAAVIYGSATRSGNVYLLRGSLEPALGFMVESAVEGDGTGFAVSGTGDVNGDGYDDVVIGAPWAAHGVGAAYVIYGGEPHGTVTVEPGAVPAGAGFVIHGPTQGLPASPLAGYAGWSVAGGADVNGDGIDDTVIAAPFAGYLTSGGSVPNLGEVAVVYGVAGGRGELTMPAPNGSMDPADGYLIEGPYSETNFSSPYDPPAGTQTIALGDVNDDGRADVVVGTGKYRFVTAALGFGRTSFAYPASAAVTVGEALDLAPSAVGRTGDASYSISPALPAGLSLDPTSGEISGAPLAAQPSTTYTVRMQDLAGSAEAPLALTVDAPEESKPGGGGNGNEGGTGDQGGNGQGGAGQGGGPGPGVQAPPPPRLTLGGLRTLPGSLTTDATGKLSRARLTFRLSQPAIVVVTIKGRAKATKIRLGRRPGGANSVNLRPLLARHHLVPGHYRLTVTATTNGETATRTSGLRVKAVPHA